MVESGYNPNLPITEEYEDGKTVFYAYCIETMKGIPETKANHSARCIR